MNERCDKINEYEIYPWIHQSSNNMSSKDHMCCVKFPNTALNKLSSDNRFSMAAGDFLEIYNEEGFQFFFTLSLFWLIEIEKKKMKFFNSYVYAYTYMSKTLHANYIMLNFTGILTLTQQQQ